MTKAATITRLEVCVPGNPVGQPRAPHSPVIARRSYIPAKHPVHAWRRAVAMVAQAEASRIGLRLAGPLRAELEFRLRRPLRHWIGNRAYGRLRDDAPRWHEAKPDGDNLEKAVLDALMPRDGGGVIAADDSSVVEVVRRKVWADARDEVGVRIVLEEVEG